jgi:hypothetical protein
LAGWNEWGEVRDRLLSGAGYDGEQLSMCLCKRGAVPVGGCRGLEIQVQKSEQAINEISVYIQQNSRTDQLHHSIHGTAQRNPRKGSKSRIYLEKSVALAIRSLIALLLT